MMNIALNPLKIERVVIWIIDLDASERAQNKDLASQTDGRQKSSSHSNEGR